MRNLPVLCAPAGMPSEKPCSLQQLFARRRQVGRPWITHHLMPAMFRATAQHVSLVPAGHDGPDQSTAGAKKCRSVVLLPPGLLMLSAGSTAVAHSGPDVCQGPCHCWSTQQWGPFPTGGRDRHGLDHLPRARGGHLLQ